MGFGKDILVYDLTNGGDEVSAYLKSAGGTLITDTAGALNVYNAALVALSKAEDAAHSSGDQGIQMLAVRNDAGGSLTSADGDYGSLQLDSAGRLRVVGSSQSDKAEDAASVSGDTGSYSLSVRQDVPASSTSADGDYQSFKTDVLGRLWVNDAGQAFFQNAVSIAATATQIVAAPLASRKKIIIQNRSNKAVFVGDSGMTDTTTGLGVSAGSTVELPAGPACDLYAIVASGTADVRFLEV